MEIGTLTSRGRYHHRHHHGSFITVVRHIGAAQFTGVRLFIGDHDLIGVHVMKVAVIGEVLVGEFAPDGAVRVGEVGLAGADEVGECTAAGKPFRVTGTDALIASGQLPLLHGCNLACYER
jgi:hypothetical protein